jgi:hypothetical protein
VEFRKSLAISATLHVGLLVATLIALPKPSAYTVAPLISIPLDLIDDISEDPQITGERDGVRSETPQRREAPRVSQRPDPVPEPPPQVRPTEAASAPPPPPPPPDRAEPMQPVAVPTPSPPPPRPQVAQREELDPEGLLRRLEEKRRREEQVRQAEQQRQEEQRRQEQARREEQRRQEQARREEQRRQQQQQQFNAQQMRDLINRQQGAPAPSAQQGQTQRQASLGNPQGTGRRLTQSQFALLVGMIRDQVQPCWSPPVGGIAGNRLIVRIEIAMNRDGTLNGRPRVMNSSADPQFRAVSDSAVRAIMRCSPLRLPAEMYDAPNGWREIEFAFDPQQMS